jgi:hypothetical protein
MPIPLAAIPAAAQGVTGLVQLFKGAALSRKERPEYKIPSEISQNLSQAEMMALEGLPSEQKQQFIENAQRTSQFRLKAGSERSVDVIEKAAQGEVDANRNLLSADSAAKFQNINTLMGKRDVMAGYKDKAFEVNEMQPFMAQMQAAQAMKGSGMQNVYGGLTAGIKGIENQRLMQDIMGTGATSTPSESNEADMPGGIYNPSIKDAAISAATGAATGGLAALMPQEGIYNYDQQQAQAQPQAPIEMDGASRIVKVKQMLNNPFIGDEQKAQLENLLRLLGA